MLSAWCLGVLNSHRRFFLSYVAPVVWNAAIIVALLAAGGGLGQYRLAEIAAWGSVVGSLLQFGVQLPTVLGLLGGLHPGRLLAEPVRAVVRTFVPVFIGRGVVQISAYVDTMIASLLPTGAVAAVSYAQVLYTLPVSLFGMSVSAAELPEMSSATGTEAERATHLRTRLENGLRQIAFFVVPSAVAFVALGRCGDRSTVPVRRIHPRDDGLRVGDSRGRVGGPPPFHSRTALRLGVLRAARYEERRYASPSSALGSESCWGTPWRSTARRPPGSRRGGAPPASLWPRGWRRAWSTCSSEVPWAGASAGHGSTVD